MAVFLTALFLPVAPNPAGTVHSRKKQFRICELKEQEKSNDTNRIFFL
jgi:hypothetical protein